MSYQEFMGKFTITSANQTFSVGGYTYNIPTGDYYLKEYTGETGSQLVETMASLIVANYAGATVAYDQSAGTVTIAIGTTNTVTFTDTALATLLGYTSTSYSGNAAGYTAERQPRYIWRPSRAPSDYIGDPAYYKLPSSNTQFGVSPTGRIYTVGGNDMDKGRLTYDYLAKAEVLKAATPICNSFQEFWSDILHAGMPFRLIFDRESYADTGDFLECAIDPGSETLGDFEKLIKRTIPQYDGYYSVSIEYAEYA